MSNQEIALAQALIPENVQAAVLELETMGLRMLRTKYRDVFKEDSRSNNAAFLRKRIAWRLQEMVFGGLSDRAKARIQELAADAPIRRSGLPSMNALLGGASKPGAPERAQLAKRDPRLPPAGTALRRRYGNEVHAVVVEDDGFVFRGERHTSLSAIARLITGTAWNGFAFFGLTKPWGTR